MTFSSGLLCNSPGSPRQVYTHPHPITSSFLALLITQQDWQPILHLPVFPVFLYSVQHLMPPALGDTVQPRNRSLPDISITTSLYWHPCYWLFITFVGDGFYTLFGLLQTCPFKNVSPWRAVWYLSVHVHPQGAKWIQWQWGTARLCNFVNTINWAIKTVLNWEILRRNEWYGIHNHIKM